MSSPSIASFLALFMTVALGAQSFVVSPPYATITEGGTSSDIPFTNVARYQQITGDLRGTARTLQALALRRDGVLPPNGNYVARTLDLQVLCCNSSYTGASSTFASNYVGAPTVVYTRKLVGLPDFTGYLGPFPAPWQIQLPFDVPFPYAGTSDLLYELKTFSTTASTAYVVDAVSSRDSAQFGGSTSVGTGCSTQNGWMNVRAAFLSSAMTQTITFNWTVELGPTNALAGLLVGFTNPNVVVPNLCPNSGGNRLYCDGAVASLLGSTDALGRWILPTLTVPYNPAFVGGTLTAQAAAVDLIQQGLNVAVSNGIATSVAAAPSPFQIARVSAVGAGATTATTGTPAFGLGFVTRYQY